MNQRPNPLEIPEILSRVGLYIPLWIHSSEYSSRPGSWRPRFAPQHLLNCILVNKTWHDILLPILWFSLDDISVPSLLHAFNTLSKHSRHLRILELSRLALGTISLPLSLLPHNLLHLNLNGLGNNQWARALVLQNTRLQSLRWQGGDFHRDNYYETLDALALSKRLHRLQDLCLECWKLDGSFMKLLRKNPSLKRISLDYVSGEVQDKFTPWDATHRNQGDALKGNEEEEEERENDDDDDNDEEETEVILPDLVSLTVCKDVESGALEALIRLCPGLEELSWMGPNDGDLRQLTTNIRECCPSLSSLTYSTVDISEDESLYAELIRSVPHLVELQIKIPALGDAFTEALIKHAPTLEILELTISGNHVNCNANFKRILTSCHQITALSIEGSKCGAASLFSFNWACLRLNRLLLVGLQSIAQDPPYNTDSESIAAMHGWTVAAGGDGTAVSPIQHEIFNQAEGEGIDGVTTTEEIRQYAEGQDAAPQICTRFLRRLLTHLQTMRHLQSFFLNGVEYTRMLTDCSEPIYI